METQATFSDNSSKIAYSSNPFKYIYICEIYQFNKFYFSNTINVIDK